MFFFRTIIKSIQQKIIEELEDWKDKQMLLFNENVIILLILLIIFILQFISLCFYR